MIGMKPKRKTILSKVDPLVDFNILTPRTRPQAHHTQHSPKLAFRVFWASLSEYSCF